MKKIYFLVIGIIIIFALSMVMRAYVIMRVDQTIRLSASTDPVYIQISGLEFNLMDERLKHLEGQRINMTGELVNLKGYLIKLGSGKNATYYCLTTDKPIEDTKNATVIGTVEKRIDDFGECKPETVAQRCGRFLMYCIKVEEIITSD